MFFHTVVFSIYLSLHTVLEVFSLTLSLIDNLLRPSAALCEWRETGFPCRVRREINVPGETLEPVFTSPTAVLRT